VDNTEVSEDIMAVRVNYKRNGTAEYIIVIVCYMLLEGQDTQMENERKYEKVRE